MKTKLEIIEETVRYYSEDPSRQSKNHSNGACYYLSPDGKKCAFGRCCIDPKVTWSGPVYHIFDRETRQEIHYEDALMPEYRGHGYVFWKELQNLHDLMLDGTGFTKDGQKEIHRMKEYYNARFK